MGILIGIAVVVMLGGGIFYNKLRTVVYGVIGVGGSYIATIGIMMLVALIRTIFGGESYDTTSLITGIIFMIIGLGYLVYVMIFRCNTVKQRVLLPIIAVMIAFGFCWRFVLALIFKVPMGNGAPESPKFPNAVEDDNGDLWHLVSDSGDHAEYQCDKTGAYTTLWYTGDYVNLPVGWRSY